MSLEKYCPLGSPSLLNGDFFENLARLTDFSWSVIFSSAPPSPVQVNLTSKPTGIRTGGSSSEEAAVKGFEHDAIWNIFMIAAFALYVHLVYFIGKKVASRIKFTRENAVRFHCISCSMFALSLTLMFLSRTFPTVWPIFLSHVVWIHVMFFGWKAAHKNVDDLKISCIDADKYKNRNLKCVFIVLAVLFFFFAPVYQSSFCQPLFVRLHSEVSFYLLFGALAVMFCEVNNARFLLSAKRLFYYEDGKAVRRCVKKEGFGWIEQDIDDA